MHFTKIVSFALLGLAAASPAPSPDKRQVVNLSGLLSGVLGDLTTATTDITGDATAGISLTLNTASTVINTATTAINLVSGLGAAGLLTIGDTTTGLTTQIGNIASQVEDLATAIETQVGPGFLKGLTGIVVLIRNRHPVLLILVALQLHLVHSR